MVLGKLPVPGRPTVGKGPIALAVGAGGGGLDIFTLYIFTRYRLKYCLKGRLNPKQPTNQPSKEPNNVFFFTFVFSKKKRLDVSYESI